MNYHYPLCSLPMHDALTETLKAPNLKLNPKPHAQNLDPVVSPNVLRSKTARPDKHQRTLMKANSFTGSLTVGGGVVSRVRIRGGTRGTRAR